MVKQKTPEILDAAVAATLELESYLPQKLTSVSSVEVVPVEEDLKQATINVVNQGSDDKLVAMFEKLSDRFDKLEAAYSQKGDQRYSGRGGHSRQPDQRGHRRGQRGHRRGQMGHRRGQRGHRRGQRGHRRGQRGHRRGQRGHR